MKKKILFNLIIITLIISLIFSSYKIIKYKIDEHNLKNQINNINNKININEITNEEVEIINQTEKIPKSNPYWDYINMNLIDVNLNELKKINNDIKGWIKVNGTNINYPFVQGVDNDYYLTHSIDKSHNVAGWVFLDYRNDLLNTNNKNTILYAHGMNNNTMFGSLRNILNSNWFDNPNNYVIKTSTEYENSLWQIFSIYRIKTTNDYIKTTFQSDKEFEEFYTTIQKRSSYNFNTNVSSTDKILTLSTCYNNSDKVVLHAKLIKRNTK